MKIANGVMLASAVASLFASAALAADKAPKKDAKGTAPAEVRCEGVNECKGKGACGGATHGCAGQNECMGKGWVVMSAKDCEAKGGKNAGGASM